MELRAGTIKTLKKIKKTGLKIAIVTDLTTRVQLRKLSKLKIVDYVDVLVTSEEAGREKPSPIMFLLALNKLNILSSEAFMVGDNPKKDIEGANSVGIDTILITSELSDDFKFSNDYEKPNYKIKNIPDLLKILKL